MSKLYQYINLHVFHELLSSLRIKNDNDFMIADMNEVTSLNTNIVLMIN